MSNFLNNLVLFQPPNPSNDEYHNDNILSQNSNHILGSMYSAENSQRSVFHLPHHNYNTSDGVHLVKQEQFSSEQSNSDSFAQNVFENTVNFTKINTIQNHQEKLEKKNQKKRQYEDRQPTFFNQFEEKMQKQMINTAIEYIKSAQPSNPMKQESLMQNEQNNFINTSHRLLLTGTLKVITSFIFELINIMGQISVQNILKKIYEIIVENLKVQNDDPSLENKIYSEVIYKYAKKQKEKRESLARRAERYTNEKEIDKIMKNIKRRLYDALNVLLAANIIRKNKNVITLTSKGRITAVEHSKEESSNNILEEIKQKQKSIQAKRLQLNQLTKTMISLKRLVQRNSKQLTTTKTEVIEFPLIITETIDPQIEVTNTKVQIQVLPQSQSNILSKLPIYADLNILQYLFEVNEEEVKKEQTYQRRRILKRNIASYLNIENQQ